MIIAYTNGFGPDPQIPELCLIPEKPDMLSRPVVVDYLFETKCAIYRLSPQEVFTIALDPKDNGLVIRAVKPTAVCITPNFADKPATKVTELKIIREGAKAYRILYIPDTSGDKAWREWNPITQLQNM